MTDAINAAFAHKRDCRRVVARSLGRVEESRYAT